MVEISHICYLVGKSAERVQSY